MILFGNFVVMSIVYLFSNFVVNYVEFGYWLIKSRNYIR